MLGDTDPKQLGKAVVPGTYRDHVLRQELARALLFQRNPDADPRTSFPHVKWIQLRGSSLWISYGELTSLAYWLPPYFDTLPRRLVLPGLQRMRQDTCLKITKFMLPGNEDVEDASPRFEGAATIGGATGWAYRKPGVESDKAVDTSIAELGSDRYLSLVARNACHFAPYSWHRWPAFHQEARDFALAYYHNTTAARPVKDIDTGADQHLRQAWLQKGYGDHFLQDSFAAGHLINKTLVMQWFVDYVNGLASPW